MCSLCVPLSVRLVLVHYVGGTITVRGVVSCVLSVYPCLLVLCRHYVNRGSFMCSLCVPLSVGLVPALRTGGGSSCVLSVYPCLLVLVPALRQGGG